MRVRVQSWENGVALLVPQALAAQSRIEAGASVDLAVIEGKLVVTPLVGPIPISRELLANATPEDTHIEPAGSDDDELERRREVGRRIEALRRRIFVEQGEMPDSADLIREDRAR